MSSIELPPNSLKSVLAGEPRYSLNRQRISKEQSQASDVYRMLKDAVDPFMGKSVSVRREYKLGVTVHDIRYATSRPVTIEDSTWVFIIREDNVANSKLPTYHIGAFDGQGKESQNSLYVATPWVILMKGLELATQEEFCEFQRTVKFIGQHLIAPSERL